jgi:hypothetical protein
MVLIPFLLWKVGLPLSPPQRLLKNMKFEGIEIALEGIWYEENR